MKEYKKDDNLHISTESPRPKINTTSFVSISEKLIHCGYGHHGHEFSGALFSFAGFTFMPKYNQTQISAIGTGKMFCDRNM